jgi:hypothetical protein
VQSADLRGWPRTDLSRALPRGRSKQDASNRAPSQWALADDHAGERIGRELSGAENHCQAHDGLSYSRKQLPISKPVTISGRPKPRRSSADGRTGSGWCGCGGAFRRLDRRAPVINFRSEGRRFPKGRCLIPASHFFEFTGTKSPKSKWKFTRAGEDWFCFAGLWRPMPHGAGDAFALLTTDPGPDVAPIHDRQMVVLDRPDWLAWLDLTRPESELLRPLPAGSLAVEQVR